MLYNIIRYHRDSLQVQYFTICPGCLIIQTVSVTDGGAASDPVIGTVGVKADMRYFGKTLKNRFQHDIW